MWGGTATTLAAFYYLFVNKSNEVATVQKGVVQLKDVLAIKQVPVVNAPAAAAEQGKEGKGPELR